MRVTFYGVRGSTPSPSAANQRYGGNTSCVVLEVDGEPPIILDLGTGARLYGRTQPLDGSFRGTALVTHLHWDHVQGLPFFEPADRPGAQLSVRAPVDGGSLEAVFDTFMGPPFFPLKVRELRGEVTLEGIGEGEWSIGAAKVLVRPVPHKGITVGYRVEWDGASVAYISDHLAPPDLTTVDPGPLELADHVDLLIHDAQYTRDDWIDKAHWGHCTIDFALRVAAEAGARKIALSHHDPSRSDDELDRLGKLARTHGEELGVEVVMASEGLTLEMGVEVR
jgi:phosphoribosyl 1,2-cyclic phosphodiesterase